MHPWQLGAADIVNAVSRAELSVTELVTSLLDRIGRLNPTMRAWTTVDAAAALAYAEELDASPRDERPPLSGLPMGFKDVIHTAGLRTTASSKALVDFVPEKDAAVVASLRAAGALILGKLETCEFANGDPPVTLNPWDPPAPRAAHPAVPPSRWHSAWFRPRSEPRPGARPSGRPRTTGSPGSSRRTGSSLTTVSSRWPGRWTTSGSRASLATVASMLADAGAEVREVSEPGLLEPMRAICTTVIAAEAATYHREQYARVGHLYGPKISATVERGLRIPAHEYVSAQRRRAAAVRALEEWSANIEADAFVTLTVPAPAPADLTSTGDPSYLVPWTVAGLPAVSIPTGISACGLPMAAQLVGRRGCDWRLLEVARWAESVTGFDARPPAWQAGDPAGQQASR